MSLFFFLVILFSFSEPPAMDSNPGPVYGAGAESAEAGAVAAATPAPVDLPGATDEVGTRVPCEPWVLTEDDYARAQELIAHGWFGDPSDGMEALYPPGC